MKTQTYACDHRKINKNHSNIQEILGKITLSDEYEALQDIEKIFGYIIDYLYDYRSKDIEDGCFEDRVYYSEMSDMMMDLLKENKMPLENHKITQPLEYPKYQDHLFKIANKLRINYNNMVVKTNSDN
jgi:hypothetical protein